jgi:hypothetical protein
MAGTTLREHQRLALIRTGVHPFIFNVLGTSPEALERSPTTYHPAMAPYLPKPSDARGILHFYGLNDATISRILSTKGSKLASVPGKIRNAAGKWEFPLALVLESVYLTTAPQPKLPVPRTYSSYYSCGLQQGLRPEFACTLGLHSQDPRNRYMSTEFYDLVSAVDGSRDIVVSNCFILRQLWLSQMEWENKESTDETNSKR